MLNVTNEYRISLPEREERGWRSLKKLGGVHAPHCKNTADSEADFISVSSEVTIPMVMHRGKAAICQVKAGDYVKVGQKIGEADGADSAHVHSSVSGKVIRVETTDRATGKNEICVVIETDGLQEKYEKIKPPTIESLDDFLQAIRDSGVVGLGGAVAPTGPKLTLRDPSKIDTLIINGAECEPYMTCDTRTMIDDKELLWQGIRHISRYLKIPNIVIAIEENKPEPIRIMREFCEREGLAKVFTMPSIYPQGGKKTLIYHITGRITMEGQRPGDVGCIVINCSTLSSIERYIYTGMPMVAKRVTVDGSAVKKPQNIIVPLGMKIADVFESCGGFTTDARKIIVGGPMMGEAVPSEELSVVKGTNTLLAFKEKDAISPPETPCIRCGRCVSHCPMGVMTVDIQDAYLLEKPEILDGLKPGLCMECGCCAFICPARRPLTQYMRLAKSALRTYRKRMAAVQAKGEVK